jgi:preprotein translocase subunit YajC
MLILFWFMIVKPAKTRQKKHAELVQSLSVGDEVVTAGGIYGKVTKVGEDSVELQVAANVSLKMDRRAIRRRRGEKDDD